MTVEVLRVLADFVGDTQSWLRTESSTKDVMLRTARELQLDETLENSRLSHKDEDWQVDWYNAFESRYKVEYDEAAAHDAAYDVRVTSQCLARQLASV